MVIQREYFGDCLLFACAAFRLSRGPGDSGVGLGTMGEAEAPIVDDLLDFVVRRVSTRVGIGIIRAMDNPLRRGRRIRAHSWKS